MKGKKVLPNNQGTFLEHALAKKRRLQFAAFLSPVSKELNLITPIVELLMSATTLK